MDEETENGIPLALAVADIEAEKGPLNNGQSVQA